MLYAVNDSGDKVTPSGRGYATCPFCGGTMRSKCGDIRIWHWAHLLRDCEPWHEAETDWHRDWKSCMPSTRVEVAIQRHGIVHRADIQTKAGFVVEFQHSPISEEDAAEREEFYRPMIWVFDVREQAARRFGPVHLDDKSFESHQLELYDMVDLTGALRLEFWDKSYWNLPIIDEGSKTSRMRMICWHWPKKVVTCGRKARVYLDLGDQGMLRLVKFHPYKNRGWGYWGSRQEFIEWMQDN